MDIREIAIAWPSLAGTVFVPHTEEEYNQIVALLDQLIDEVQENESHPSNAWRYVGDYKVERWTQDPVEIERRTKSSGRTEITSVLYLKGS
ncbi:MAG TPA: hypothetical protein VGL29_08875 [Blastocatellia bacterium]|jgi:HTH-type transcriptional regulator/antitoxin HigA